MYYDVKLPEKYAKIITKKSESASRINKSAAGHLSGHFEGNSIIVDEIVPALFVTGYDTSDYFKALISFPIDHVRRYMKEGGKNFLMPYLSDPFMKTHEKDAEATIFYFTEIDQFEAVNRDGKERLLEIVSDDRSIIETFGDQTPGSFEKSDSVLGKSCIYEISAQLGNKQNITVKLPYEVTFSPGIAEERTLIFDNFMGDVLEKLGLGHTISKKRVRHLEIKRDDGIIIWKY